MAESPDDIAATMKTKSPVLISLKDTETETYFLCVERKVLVGNIKTFCKGLALWFAIHYVFNMKYDDAVSGFALFYQEFVVGIPSPKARKSVTYLTVVGTHFQTHG